MDQAALGALTAAKSRLFRKDGTAQGVAKQRLIESIAEPDKRVIDDPYADLFVKGASIIKCLGHNFNVWAASKIVPGLHEHLIARTRVVHALTKPRSAPALTWKSTEEQVRIGQRLSIHP